MRFDVDSLKHGAVPVIAVGLTVLGADAVNGQPYPNRPVRILTAQAAGGTDLVARLIAQGLTSSFGQQVLVDNRGVRAIDAVAKSQPDGYSLLLYGPTMWLLPLLQDNVSYDPVRDFAPITLTISSPNVLVVHPSLPVNSVRELIALAKARPGELNFGASATGGSIHLAGELFKSMAGINIVRVSYKGIAQAMTSLMGGEIQMMFPNAPAVIQHVKSGRLKALAVTSAHPTALAPGLPTVAATGLPGYESVAVFGMFAPAGTPPALVNRLNSEIVRILSRPEVKEDLFKAGVETVGSTPGELAALVKSDLVKWGRIIKEAGIH